jgi:hypothetical protein
MRTTINLDADAHEIATLYSKERGISLSAAINELACMGVEALRSEPARLKRAPNGLLVFADSGTAITNETVKAASEELSD